MTTGRSVVVRWLAKTPEWRVWVAARDRCTKPTNSDWKNYGGRGIEMCAEWLQSFAAFFAHLGPRPSRSHSLDRIKNDGHYQPGNVRWATKSQQNANRRK